MERTTIAAISTPLGVGGIGVVRLSGDGAVNVAEQVFRSVSGKPLAKLGGYRGLLGRIVDGEEEVDDAIAFVYRAPKSYTGEDVVELSCHGGIWAVRKTLRLCLERGASPAGPGEFTKRAFLNGKMNLLQAEGVADLVAAQGESAMKAALSARDGALSTAVEGIVESLLAQSAHLAAWADYPEEEMEEVEGGALLSSLTRTEGNIKELLATWNRGKLLREGIQTAIVGKPNVGKSTLMNLLAGEGRSIVTDIPGTTRDVVEDSVALGPWTLRLADTAGIRDTLDPVEVIGVDLAKGRMETASLILAVFDWSDPLTGEDIKLLELLREKPCIAVINKMDLERKLDSAAIEAAIPRVVTISAKSGLGREELEREVSALLELGRMEPGAALVSNERQRWHLGQAAEFLGEAIAALEQGMTLDAVHVALDAALDSLFSLTGRRVTDEVVDQVFSNFCVGK